MKFLGLSLMLLVPAAARAEIGPLLSPAMQQLQGVEGQEIRGGSLESAANKGSLGFTVQTLQPVGYVSEDGGQPDKTPVSPMDEKEPLPAPTGSGHYIFEGHTPIKGVTIYTPKDDPTGNGRTEKPKPAGPISNKLVYGALGLGAAATIGGIFFAPLLFLGGLLLGAGAVCWFINRKFAK